jgi:hypothetical protein
MAIQDIATVRPHSVHPGTTGAWVSKRALYAYYQWHALEEQAQVASWHRFLIVFREIHPNKTKSFELKDHTNSGILIARWSEVFIWISRPPLD